MKVIHSDLKPENVIMMSDGYFKITDFGLSQHKSEIKVPRGTYNFRSPGKKN